MRQMHLLAFVLHTPINHIMMSWTDPSDTRATGMAGFDHWIEMARTLERGCFDGIFFADVPAAYDMYKQSTDDTVRYGVAWPAHDPVSLFGAMASHTKHIGLASTISVSTFHPYALVRILSTLDYLTRGRIGWNVVTGHARSEHRALGLEQMEHDERYDRAEEYMQVCYGLWNGVPPEAILMDPASGVFVDPSRIKKVDFEGKYLKCRATPPTLPSPQGRPVLFQAGSSGRGQQFAARHADVVFTMGVDLPGMRKSIDSLRQAKLTAGVANDAPVVLAVQPFLGGTEEEAHRRRSELLARIPVDAVLARVSGSLGVDFSELDLDQPLAELKTQASRGLMAMTAAMFSDTNMTIREAVLRTGWVGAIPPVIGTPEQVADQLETIWRQTGCLGFNLSAALSPGSMDEFVNEVVPILQKRGIFRTEYTGTTFRGHLFEK